MLRQDSSLRRLEKGTTYNSYIIYGDKTALVDASHEKFRGLYMDTLKQELKSKGRKLDYVVVSHTEPDHSGAPALPLAAWNAEPQNTSISSSIKTWLGPYWDLLQDDCLAMLCVMSSIPSDAVKIRMLG